MRTMRWVVLMCLLGGLIACGGPAPTTPPGMAPSIDGWTRIGLACVGPASSNDPDGLLKWTCSGTLRGIAVRGPVAGGQHAYALTRDWLGEPATPDRERSLAELARRFLAGHGPADERDLAKWAGVRLRDARAGLDAAARSLVQRDDGLVGLARRRAVEPLPAPRLLGSFDPVLHGWTSREPLLGPNEPRVTLGGLFRPFALVEGRAVAAWTLRDGAVVLEPFQRLPPWVAAALEADAEAVLRFLRE